MRQREGHDTSFWGSRALGQRVPIRRLYLYEGKLFLDVGRSLEMWHINREGLTQSVCCCGNRDGEHAVNLR